MADNHGGRIYVSKWDFWGLRFYALAFAPDRQALEDEAEKLRGEGYSVDVYEYSAGIWCLEGYMEKSEDD